MQNRNISARLYVYDLNDLTYFQPPIDEHHIVGYFIIIKLILDLNHDPFLKTSASYEHTRLTTCFHVELKCRWLSDINDCQTQDDAAVPSQIERRGIKKIKHLSTHPRITAVSYALPYLREILMSKIITYLKFLLLEYIGE